MKNPFKMFDDKKRLMTDVIVFYKRRFFVLFGVLLLLYIPAGLFWEYFSLNSGLLVEINRGGSAFVGYASALCVYAVTVLLFMFYLLAVFYAVVRSGQDHPVGAFGAVRWSMRHFGVFLKLFIVYLARLIAGLFCLVLPVRRPFVFFSFFPVVFIQEGAAKAWLAMEQPVPGRRGRISHWGHIVYITAVMACYCFPTFIILNALMGYAYMQYYLGAVHTLAHVKNFVATLFAVFPCIYYYLYYREVESRQPEADPPLAEK